MSKADRRRPRKAKNGTQNGIQLRPVPLLRLCFMKSLDSVGILGPSLLSCLVSTLTALSESIIGIPSKCCQILRISEFSQHVMSQDYIIMPRLLLGLRLWPNTYMEVSAGAV